MLALLGRPPPPERGSAGSASTTIGLLEKTENSRVSKELAVSKQFPWIRYHSYPFDGSRHGSKIHPRNRPQSVHRRSPLSPPMLGNLRTAKAVTHVEATR